MPSNSNTDWLTDELEGRNDVLVADRDWLKKLYGISSGAEFSLRIISNLSSGKHLPMLVVRHENLRVFDAPEMQAALKDLKGRVLAGFGWMPMIVVQPGDAPAEPEYGLYLGWQRRTQIHTGAQLAARFAEIRGEFVVDPGCRKAVNASAGDAFRAFSRTYLARQLVVQDIDLLQRVGEGWRPIETKRIGGRAQFWAPYANDAVNYTALNAAAKAFGLQDPICVAYPRAARGPVAVLTVAARDGNLAGRRCMSDAAGMLTAVPDTAYISDRRMAA